MGKRRTDSYLMTNTTGTTENRMLFDDSWAWLRDDAGIHTLIDQLQGAGFNTYVPALWRGAGVTWPTTYLAPFLANPGTNPWDNHSVVAANKNESTDQFGRFVALAQAEGLQVIPAMGIFQERRGSSVDAFLLPDWYVNTGEAWPQNAFNAHDSSFRTFIVGLIEDVLKNYPVDGIYLDYVRAGTGWYLNTEWATLYNTDTGRVLADDLAAINSWAQSGGDPAPDALALPQWFEGVVGDIVRRVRVLRDTYIPGKPIMMYGIGNNREAYYQGQDLEKWVNAGDMDLCTQGWYGIPSTAGTVADFAARKSWLTKPEALVPILSTYLLPSLDPATGAEVTGNLQDYKRVKGRNSCLYNWGQFNISADQEAVLGSGIFKHKATADWRVG